jgi:hypothetical protein
MIYRTLNGITIGMLIMSGCFVLPGNLAASSPSVTEILRQADKARGNIEGVIWKVTIEAREKNRTNVITYKVSSRGFDLFADSLAPPKYKGYKLVMLNGNMWFYKPGLSKPVPISRRQKLNGKAAYGDIASTNYADDYEALQLEDEIIDGEECYLFDLKSKNRRTTYDRVKYWISKERRVGVQAEYYTVSDKLFKLARMEYENKVEVDGQPQAFISRIVISDKLLSDDITILSFTEPKLKKLPDYIFNLNLLRR